MPIVVGWRLSVIRGLVTFDPSSSSISPITLGPAGNPSGTWCTVVKDRMVPSCILLCRFFWARWLAAGVLRMRKNVDAAGGSSTSKVMSKSVARFGFFELLGNINHLFDSRSCYGMTTSLKTSRSINSCRLSVVGI